MGKYIFANKLMFAIIMRDPIACKKFIEMIFPERTVEKILFPNKAEEKNFCACALHGAYHDAKHGVCSNAGFTGTAWAE